jgi:hypothetical protein
LFLGSQIADIPDNSKFPISQDQRNTARARVRFQAVTHLWFAVAAEFGSGLPVTDPISYNDALPYYGAAIVNQVNFGAGRVRPNFSLDASAGATLYHKEAREISFQLEVNNLTDRLNVLNFASLFSGTAIAAPRSASARLKLAF